MEQEETPAPRTAAEEKIVLAPLEQSEVIDGFEILNAQNIGGGAFGYVLKSKRLSDGKEVALKFLNKGAKPIEYSRFQMEVKVAKELSEKRKPFFLRFYGTNVIHSGQRPERPYFAMELGGKDLKELVWENSPIMGSNRRFSPWTALFVGNEVLKALQTMHISQYVHLDVKPANIIVGHGDTERKRIILIDYGLSKHWPVKSQASSKPYGTQYYTSLNADQKGIYGPADDIWSWFFVVLEFYKGYLPWTDGGNVRERKAKMLSSEDFRIWLEEHNLKEFITMYELLKQMTLAEGPKYNKLHSLIGEMAAICPGNGLKECDWENNFKFFRDLKVTE